MGYKGKMSSFERLVNHIGERVQDAFFSVIEAVRTLFEGDPETRRKVAFSIAMIALSAKMAKADGIVTPAEVDAFRQIFRFPIEEAQNVTRLYNLARQDIAGFESYAEKLAGLCGSGSANCQILEDIIDGLFHIAKADGVIHESEFSFLLRVAEIFGMDEENFNRITARHVHLNGIDPYHVLGVSRSDEFHVIRKQYRVLVSQSHPDRLVARGIPEAFHGIANDRMAVLNAAYAEIERERRAA